MRITRNIATVIAGVSSVAILGAGVAMAAADPTPSAFQVCGTVYSGAAFVDNYHGTAADKLLGTPAAAVPQANVQVKGQPSFGSAVFTTTNANGQYCFTGDAAMMGAITLGGNIKITAPAYPTATVPHPSGITSAVFNNHQVGTTSATGFNIVIP